MYNSLIIRNSYLAEVQLTQVPANGSKIYFLDIPQLRGVPSVGVEAFSSAAMTFSPNGNAMIPSTRGLAVTFAVDSLEKFVLIPCFTLECAQNAGIIRELAKQKINLPKSYVTILDATLYSQNQSICFNFYYTKEGLR